MTRPRPYENHRAVSWTRIDMLLALYEAALTELEKARMAHAEADTILAKRHCLRALRVVYQLRCGVDPKYGEVAVQLDKLFDYVLTCIAGGSAANVDDSIVVLSTLRDGFEEIRVEAIELEKTERFHRSNSLRLWNNWYSWQPRSMLASPATRAPRAPAACNAE